MGALKSIATNALEHFLKHVKRFLNKKRDKTQELRRG